MFDRQMTITSFASGGGFFLFQSEWDDVTGNIAYQYYQVAPSMARASN